MAALSRTIAVWCPDWPVVAALRAGRADGIRPLALIDRGLVHACDDRARASGVRRGLREREAQARCPELVLLPHVDALDARTFDPVVEALECLTPGVQLVRPGLCAVRAKGPARYYGGEDAAARVLLEALAALGLPAVRIGVADTPFCAQQAARTARDGGIRRVPEGEAAAFLAELPVEVLGSGDAELAPLLRKLGLPTLGAFAALPAVQVRERFGPFGARAHALAGAADGERVVPDAPGGEFERKIEFEEPLDRTDRLAFAFRAVADDFVAALLSAKLVCTTVRIAVREESGSVRERSWLHPRWFTAADIVDRLRWQLEGTGGAQHASTSPIVAVRVAPQNVDAVGHHEAMLWGGAPDERVHHGLSRVQSLLGHEAVLTARVGGGRLLADRQRLAPWGERAPKDAATGLPWPGSLSAPHPASVFAPPVDVVVLDRHGGVPQVDERGALTAEPERFGRPGSPGMTSVAGWSGPWPVHERWWDAARARDLYRFQLVDGAGDAWLLLCEAGHWSAEARYD